MASKIGIRGAFSDNTHERFTPVQTEHQSEHKAAESPTPGTVSHIVVVSQHSAHFCSFVGAHSCAASSECITSSLLLWSCGRLLDVSATHALSIASHQFL